MMTDFKWDKDNHQTYYNQWDYKIPRSYKERYGIDYDKNDYVTKDEKMTEYVLIVIAILIIVGMLWLQN